MERQGRRFAPPLPPNVALFLIDEVAAAVLLPTGFRRRVAARKWLLLAVADGLDAAGADPRRHQGVFHGRGTLVAQGQVVFRGSALIAVPPNREVDIGVLIEELRVG